MDISILLLADFANADSSGKLNVIGAFNRILVRSVPYRHPQMHLLIRMVAELGEFNEERMLRVERWNEDGVIDWVSPDIPFKIAPPMGGIVGVHDAFIGFQQTEFPKPGRYDYKVFVEKNLKGSIPLDIVLRQEPDVSEQ